MSKSLFSFKLKKILADYGIKNSVLASELQYDESYISKWTNGKSLPSRKNAKTVISKIAGYIAEADSEYQTDKDSSAEEIRQRIYNELTEAYKRDTRDSSDENTKETYLPLVSQQFFFGELAKMRSDDDVALLDIFLLEHDVRLMVAGIENGVFIYDRPNKEKRFSLIINIDLQDDDKEKLVYDSVFLIHMLTSFSNIDLKLYENEMAVGKAIYINKEGKYISGMILPGEGIVCSCSGNNRGYGSALGQTVNHLINSEKLIYEKITMKEMIESKMYIHSVISVKVKWLMGHYTEQIIPDDVFEEILNADGTENGDILRQTHLITNLTIEQNDTDLLIYESAISKFAISGELDFYNKKIILNPGQREKCLLYLKSLIENKRDDFCCKLIERGFSSDFQYITNPSLFISDSIYYLRLENGRYEDNICHIQSEKTKKLFSRFFEVIWGNKEDTVIQDKTEILTRINYYINSVKIIEKT